MNVARLNFSHGTHEEHSETIHRIREISGHTKSHTAILQDLSGPKIRLGEFPAGAVKIERENEFILTIMILLPSRYSGVSCAPAPSQAPLISLWTAA